MPETWDSIRDRAVAESALDGSLFDALLAILNEPDVQQKVIKTFATAAAFRDGKLVIDAQADPSKVPVAPARPDYVKELDARKVKSTSKKGLLHALCHAESYAIDLSVDIIVRYGYSPALWRLEVLDSSDTDSGSSSIGSSATGGGSGELPRRMPDEFFHDWVRVAEEEAKHFTKWRLRLESLGGSYGELPGHDSLWQSALDTHHSLPARLAIVHCVHEARGLDVYTGMLSRLSAGGDAESVAILEANHAEEIGHVAAGRKWLEYLVSRGATPQDPVAVYHAYVRRYFRGSLKPPFNEVSRGKAGMTPEWWLPLTARAAAPTDAEAATAGAGAGGAGAGAEAEEELDASDMG